MSDENLTTTTEVDPAVATFYDRTLLEAATAELIHEMFAQKRPIPSKSGNTIKFRRYSNLTAATTPIPEGTTPPGQKMAKTDLTAKISQYGKQIIAVVKFSLNNWGSLNMETVRAW